MASLSGEEMGHRDKLIERILDGASDANISFMKCANYSGAWAFRSAFAAAIIFLRDKMLRRF